MGGNGGNDFMVLILFLWSGSRPFLSQNSPITNTFYSGRLSIYIYLRARCVTNLLAEFCRPKPIYLRGRDLFIEATVDIGASIHLSTLPGQDKQWKQDGGGGGYFSNFLAFGIYRS